MEQVKLAQFNKVIKDIQRAMVKLNLDEWQTTVSHMEFWELHPVHCEEEK